MHSFLRVVSAILFFVFASWAAFQYNDTDALAWIVIYGLTALCSALFAFDRLPWQPAAVLSGLSLIWALFLLPGALRGDWSLFLDETGGEVMRELLGLVIVAAWTGFLAWRVYRRTRLAAPSHTA